MRTFFVLVAVLFLLAGFQMACNNPTKTNAQGTPVPY